MFPPIFPVSIPALSELYPYGSLIWFAGVVFLWLTRYTHQFGQRWGQLYYRLSSLIRPVGVFLIGLGWLTLYSPERSHGFFERGWLPRGSWVDILNWLAIGLFFGLGIWSVAVLGIRQSFLYRHIDDPLIKIGPYALVRHPQFLSAIGITFFGIQLFNPNSFSFTVYGDLGANWSLFTLALWSLSIIEEGELISHFGDEYRDYIQRVPRLLPN